MFRPMSTPTAPSFTALYTSSKTSLSVLSLGLQRRREALDTRLQLLKSPARSSKSLPNEPLPRLQSCMLGSNTSRPSFLAPSQPQLSPCLASQTPLLRRLVSQDSLEFVSHVGCQ